MAYVRKRGSSYQITITFRPAPDMTAGQAEETAFRLADEFDMMCETDRISPEMTLSQFCERYLEIKKNVLAERTYKQYVVIINNLICKYMGSLKLNEVKIYHVQNLVNILSRSGVKPATIKRKLAVLQSVMKLAENLDLIESSPIKLNKLTMPKITRPKTEIFTNNETSEMLERLEKEPLQFRLAVQLAIITGARRGEITALKYSDFDFDNCTVTISRSAYKTAGEPVKTKAPKDNESRTIAITSEILHLVRMTKIINRADLNDWIFTDECNNLLNPQRLSTRFFSFLRKNGFKHKKFHALRHTSATLLLSGGVNIKQVQERLGHGNIKTTQIYIHCIPEADRTATDILRSMLIKSNNSVVDEEETIQNAG